MAYSIAIGITTVTPKTHIVTEICLPDDIQQGEGPGKNNNGEDVHMSHGLLFYTGDTQAREYDGLDIGSCQTSEAVHELIQKAMDSM